MHAVIFVLSPVSWETNVTKFSVVFIQKLLSINAGKNSLKMKGKKETKEKRQS